MRFEISINGEAVCVCGVEGYGVLTAMIARRMNDPDDRPEGVDMTPEEWADDRPWVDVGGFENATLEYPSWVNEKLKPGDEVTIKVLPPGPADAPAYRLSSMQDNDMDAADAV